MSDDLITRAHAALLADAVALGRLHELRGWTREAVERLGLGLDRGRVVIPVADARGEVAAILSYQPNPDKRDGTPKMMATPGARRDLFPPPESIDSAATVWLVEGEPDAISAASVGLAGVGIPGSNGWKPEMADRFSGRDVVVCCDCDAPGRGLAERVADDLVEHARSVVKVDLAPARDDHYDIGDLVREGADSPDAVRQLLLGIAARAPVHLAEQDRPPRPTLRVEDWRTAMRDFLKGRGQQHAWPIPFPELCDAADGGIRPGEVWVIAGYTSHGKSIYADQIADSCARAGAKVHIYMTEMTIVQRGLRLLARRTGIPFRNLRQRKLDERQIEVAEAEIDRMDYGASVVTDWTPQQVAADIRASRSNVAIIDLLHGFHYRDERHLSEYVSIFASAATTDAGGTGTGSAVVLIAHLNDTQMRESRNPARPKPGMHSLKGASSIKQRADTVMFVWMEDDPEDGIPKEDGFGEIWIAKARNGGTLSQSVKLDRDRLVFEERYS